VTGYALGPNTAKVDGDNDFDVVYSAGIGAAF
jgi:hypothetical protein